LDAGFGGGIVAGLLNKKLPDVRLNPSASGLAGIDITLLVNPGV
jgi:hypothetical protein